MLRLANVATPFTALTGALPDSVPLDGFVLIATEILPVNEVAVFPAASYAVTLTAGVIAVPAWALLGCTVNASCVPARATRKSASVSALPPNAAHALASPA